MPSILRQSHANFATSKFGFNLFGQEGHHTMGYVEG
jgi:hypothetical protein